MRLQNNSTPYYTTLYHTLYGKTKAKFYVVWQGREAGIYDSWAACEAQVKGVAAKYKGFATRAEAEQAFAANPEDYITRNLTAKRSTASSASDLQALCADLQRSDLSPKFPSLAVDAACSGNPGPMELRGVVVDTGRQVFHRGPYVSGTNNIGEFLAIVLGLAYLKRENWIGHYTPIARQLLRGYAKNNAKPKLSGIPRIKIYY